MKRFAIHALVAALVFGMVTADAFARPGGGRRGGASRGARSAPTRSARPASRPTPRPQSRPDASRPRGNVTPGQFGGKAAQPQSRGQLQQFLQGNRGALNAGQLESVQGRAAGRSDTAQQNFQQAQQNIQANWNSGAQPFTPAWYAQHPNAWQATHPHADAWAAASTAAVAGWLAGTAYTGTTSGGTATASETVVVVEESPPPQEEPVTATSEVGQTQSTTDSEWLPLGVYAIAPQGQKQATAMLQLSVHRDGTIRGSYYDLLSGNVQEVAGRADAQTSVAQWGLGDAGTARFETTFETLTSPAGPVQVQLGNTEPATWLMERQQNP